jgi:hypothetical protein
VAALRVPVADLVVADLAVDAVARALKAQHPVVVAAELADLVAPVVAAVRADAAAVLRRPLQDRERLPTVSMLSAVPIR